MKQLITLILMLGCGFPPFPPFIPGCIDVVPVCICDADGVCKWQFQCKDDRVW